MKTFNEYKKKRIEKNPEAFKNYEVEYEEFKLHAIGEMIKEERQKAGLTQSQLAEKMETKKSAISRLEKHCEDIKLSTLMKATQALGKKLEFSFK